MSLVQLQQQHLLLLKIIHKSNPFPHPLHPHKYHRLLFRVPVPREVETLDLTEEEEAIPIAAAEGVVTGEVDRVALAPVMKDLGWENRPTSNHSSSSSTTSISRNFINRHKVMGSSPITINSSSSTSSSSSAINNHSIKVPHLLHRQTPLYFNNSSSNLLSINRKCINSTA